MQFLVKSLATKPSGVAWWSDVEPDSYERWLAVVKSDPNVVIRRSMPGENENQIRTYTVFRTEEDFNNFQLAQAENPDAKSRERYNLVNNIQVKKKTEWIPDVQLNNQNQP